MRIGCGLAVCVSFGGLQLRMWLKNTLAGAALPGRATLQRSGCSTRAALQNALACPAVSTCSKRTCLTVDGRQNQLLACFNLVLSCREDLQQYEGCLPFCSSLRRYLDGRLKLLLLLCREDLQQYEGTWPQRMYLAMGSKEFTGGCSCAWVSAGQPFIRVWGSQFLLTKRCVRGI